MKTRYTRMHWLFGVILLVLLCDFAVTSHAQEDLSGMLRGDSTQMTSDTTNTTDSTDTVAPPLTDTTDTVIPPPADTTDTVIPPPPDTTDTVIPPPNDTIDTILPPPTINYLIDSLLLILHDNTTVMIPATFKVLDSVSVQLGNDTVPAINTMLQGMIIMPEYLYRDTVTYCVTAIGANAFRGCRGIDSIDIPPTVVDVGPYAFYQDSALSQIFWDVDESKLLRIGRCAFAETGLQAVDLPAGLQEVCDSAFVGCVNMTTVNFNMKLKILGRHAFAEAGLQAVNLPGGLREVRDSAFARCVNMTTVSLNDSLKFLGSHAFVGCLGLLNVQLGEGLRDLPVGTFQDCASMTDLVLPDRLAQMGDSALAGCGQLRNLTLNDNLQLIGAGAFHACQSLEEVKLTPKITCLRDGAFSGCDALQRFITGDSLCEVGANVLAGDSNLHYVDLRRSRKLILPDMSRDSGMFAGIPPITLVYMPNGNDSVLAINAINTLAGSYTISDGLDIDGTFVDKNKSYKGEGTYLLNQYYGDNVFGQMVGGTSGFDCYPLPYADCPKPIHCLQYYINGYLCYTQYVNDSSVISIPSKYDLNIDANAISCKYVDDQGIEQEFDFTTPIVSDMSFDVVYGNAMGDVNFDSKVDLLDLTATISRLLDKPLNIFVEENADFDHSGEVDLLDMTSLINRLLYDDQDDESPNVNLRILCFGNSYACDAYSYVPYIMKNVAPNVNLTLGVLHGPNATLESHLHDYLQSDSLYDFYYKFKGSGKWGSVKNCPIQIPLNDEKWDMIIFQQGSLASRDYSLYQPYLDSLIMVLKDTLSYPFKSGWLMIPAYPEGHSLLEGTTSDSMFYDLAACTDSVLNQTEVSFIIPGGAAIQNARTTEFNNFGYHLTFDGRHLQEGIPCLIEAYTVVQTLLNECGISASIYTDDLDVTESWLRQNAIMQLNGSPVGMTPTNRELAKFCANMAIKHPYEIEDCSWFVQW